MGIFTQPLNQNPPQNLQRRNNNEDGGGDWDSDDDIFKQIRNDPNINDDFWRTGDDSNYNSSSSDRYNYNNFNSCDSGGGD